MAFCFDDIEDCDECHEFTVDSCDDIIVESTNLVPDDELVLIVRDRYNNRYTDVITVNSTGGFTIQLDAFEPLSLFNSLGNKYEVFLNPEADPISPQPLTIDGVTNNCILLNFTVNCCFDESDEPPGGVCSNQLDFEEACNSQYITLL